MQQEDLRPWAEQVKAYHMPRYDELPAIDLYMDQVVAILEDCLRLFLRDAQEKRITPAMINNYVKLKVLPPPVKKRYTRDHLCQLILICLLKQVLSLPEIQRLIAAQLETRDVRAMYDGFCAMQERAVLSALERAAAQAGGKFGVGDVLEHGGFVGPVFGLRFELVGRIRQIERAAGKVPVLVDQGGAHLGGRIKPRGVDAHNAPVLQRKAAHAAQRAFRHGNAFPVHLVQCGCKGIFEHSCPSRKRRPGQRRLTACPG